MNRLVVVGLVAFALGVAVLVAPGLLPLTVGSALVYLVGLGALVATYRVLAARHGAGVVRATTPDPEVPTPVPIPGEDLTRAIGSFFGGRWFYRRSGLREAAVAVLVRYAGLAEAEARRRVADGSWTDDPFAAAHVGEDVPAVPLRARLARVGRFGRRESALGFERRRTIEAVAAVAGVSPPEREERSPPRLSFGDGRHVREVTASYDPHWRPTGGWRGVSVVALLAVGVGVLAQSAPVLLTGVVGVGFAAYARGSSPPEVRLAIERAVDDDRPTPGDRVAVTLTVQNLGDDLLPDVRVVDGVPAALSVVEGSPRLGTALRAGGSASSTYVVEARRGVHAFEPVTVLARDLAGSGEESRRVAVATTITGVPTLRPVAAPVPLRSAVSRYTGRVPVPTGGEGVEFYAERAYQPGDPTGRIDWNRRARTGELATLEFREERSATVVVVVDAREPCYVAADPHGPHAVDRAVAAAGRLVASLLDDGNRVGLATFGTDCWLAPGSGRAHRTRVVEMLATDPALSSRTPATDESARWQRTLERRLPADAQLLVLTPLSDARSARLVRRFDVAGHPASVVSPDPTTTAGAGPLLATVARRVRITDLRGAGVPVVDWGPDETLDAAIARSAGRWSG